MKVLALALYATACGGASAPPRVANPDPGPSTPVAITPAPSACHTAYAEYEARWRTARTDELEEFVAGDEGVLEEILFYELGTVPTRAEITRMREIYAVVEAFLWNAPWPRALAAADDAIEHCGEQTPRPADLAATD